MKPKIRHSFKNKNKLSAKKTQVDGITFDSQLEARYYRQLKLRVQAGEVLFFLRQPKFDLGGGTTYSADFIEFWNDGTTHIVDVKGFETQSFKKAKKQVEDFYPVEIKVVKKL